MGDISSSHERDEYARGMLALSKPSAGHGAQNLAVAGLMAYGVSSIIKGVRSRRALRDSQVDHRADDSQERMWAAEFRDWSRGKEPYFLAIAEGLRSKPNRPEKLQRKVRDFNFACRRVLDLVDQGLFDQVETAVEAANAASFAVELKFGPPSEYGLGPRLSEPDSTSAEDTADELWTSAFSVISQTEPDVRVALLEIRRQLREVGESKTERAGRLDDIEKAFGMRFDSLREAMFKRDLETCRALIQDGIQPMMDEVKVLFGDLVG